MVKYHRRNSMNLFISLCNSNNEIIWNNHNSIIDWLIWLAHWVFSYTVGWWFSHYLDELDALCTVDGLCTIPTLRALETGLRLGRTQPLHLWSKPQFLLLRPPDIHGSQKSWIPFQVIATRWIWDKNGAMLRKQGTDEVQYIDFDTNSDQPCT